MVASSDLFSYVGCLRKMVVHRVRALAVSAGCADLLQNRGIFEIIRVVFGREQGRRVLSQIVRIPIPDRWGRDMYTLQMVRVSLWGRAGCLFRSAVRSNCRQSRRLCLTKR